MGIYIYIYQCSTISMGLPPVILKWYVRFEQGLSPAVTDLCDSSDHRNLPKKKKKIKNIKNLGILSGWAVKVIEILVLGQDSDLGENYCFLKNF